MINIYFVPKQYTKCPVSKWQNVLCNYSIETSFIHFLCLFFVLAALNADNFSSNTYIYLALSGLAEAPSYFLPLFVLLFLGRKSTASLLFFVSGTALISILLIPQGIL